MTAPPLGDAGLARALSGHPDDTDVTPTELEAGLNYGYQQLILFTGKNDWTGNESVKDQASRAVEHFTASWVKSWWRDPDNKSQELYNRGKGMCTAIMENMKMVSPGQPTDASYTSLGYNYRTPALNPDAAPYKSPRTDY
jgi:hypothetical protein